MKIEEIQRLYFEVSQGAKLMHLYAERVQAIVQEAEARAVQAERARLYAMFDRDPSEVWRDSGFQAWKAMRESRVPPCAAHGGE